MVDNAGAPKNIVFTSNIIGSEKSDPTFPSLLIFREVLGGLSKLHYWKRLRREK